MRRLMNSINKRSQVQSKFASNIVQLLEFVIFCTYITAHQIPKKKLTGDAPTFHFEHLKKHEKDTEAEVHPPTWEFHSDVSSSHLY